MIRRTTKPLLYILDSLDALSDEAELGREITKGSFGTKAKQLSEIFRRLVVKMKKKNIQLLVISQIRDNVGVMFGKKQKRMGGKALDFYAVQVIWLAVVKKIIETKATEGKLK